MRHAFFSSHKNVLFVFGLLLVFFFWNLGAYPLMDNNEGLYARIAVEMLESGNWVIPHLNGVPYLEKPPLLYWLVALSYQVWGISEGAARFFPALAGLGLCGLLFYAFRRLKHNQDQAIEEATWSAPMILGTSLVLGVIARTVYFDMVLTFFFSLSLVSFFLWCEEQKSRDLYVGYAALALATLTKGLLAPVLAGLVMVSYFIVRRFSLKTVGAFLWNGGPFLYLAIVLPWHVMAHISHEKFSWFYFVNEHWNRFLDLREPRDYYRGPFYYYVPRVLLYLVPWVGGLFYLKKLFRPASYKSLRSLILFCSCWFLALLVFFSISKAKANYYMIAGLPPLVMLIALGLGHSEAQKIPKLFKSISLVFWLVLTGAFFLLFFHPYLIPKVSAFALITFPLHFKMASLSVFVVLGIMMMCAKTRRHFLMCTGLFSTTVMVLLTYGAPEISQQYSSKDVIESLPREALEEHRVYLYKDYENISTAVFYAGHPLPIIDSHSSDLLFGQRTGTRPDLFITLEAFEKKRAQGKPLYVIVRPLFENILAGRGLCLVHKFKRHRVYATFCAL